MKTDAELTQPNKVAERILDRAHGKHCQRQCRAMEREYICGLLIAIMLAVKVSTGNIRSSERQKPVRDSAGRLHVRIFVNC